MSSFAIRLRLICIGSILAHFRKLCHLYLWSQVTPNCEQTYSWYHLYKVRQLKQVLLKEWILQARFLKLKIIWNIPRVGFYYATICAQWDVSYIRIYLHIQLGILMKIIKEQISGKKLWEWNKISMKKLLRISVEKFSTLLLF